ncbi:serine acetyltransferase [Frankia sp. CNm7]|uniref:Serine acetyltransferase n=1 Tax=Frankia nepalensis TaxID=1836974 RepID=A0A937UQC8_9ACTN|nr:serine acetyltransferase [Frankia nepalensis]MBL7497824.1 serine acetyltransferase [Frankia nepalensis]MBL7512646.1 serine acetyltransferase [Frankia nepalensis]MBL7522023.1 serine acetyltransferase [Frankia nepalensis]MBL7631724.1 serine acetyltransferase [Frankia nepalensis]
MTLGPLVREDWVNHDRSFVHPGLHALVVYRVGHWRLTAPSWLRPPVGVLYKLVNRLLIRNVYGTEISDEAAIGRRVRIGHHQAVQIPAFCAIGDDCILRHNVTIGFTSTSAPREAVPTIGARVEIGPGSHLLGPITIGDDVKIGPNSIVTMDVPAGATVFAAPARVMRREA